MIISSEQEWLNPATEFEELYRTEFPKVFKKIIKIVQDDGKAFDLTQETFVRAFKNKDRYRPDAPPSVWLSRIGHNVAISYIRRVATERKFIHLFIEEMTTTIDIKRADSRILLSKAMRFLNKKDREVIDMYYYKDMTDEMIGKQLGIPTATAHSRRRTAIEKMRMVLGVL